MKTRCFGGYKIIQNHGLGGLGASCGALGGHVGPKAGPSLKKASILTLPWPPHMDPFGSLFSIFSSFARSDLKMAALGVPFGHHFFDEMLMKIGGLGRLKTSIIRVSGCRNHVFGFVTCFIVLGIILEVIFRPY